MPYMNSQIQYAERALNERMSSFKSTEILNVIITIVASLHQFHFV